MSINLIRTSQLCINSIPIMYYNYSYLLNALTLLQNVALKNAILLVFATGTCIMKWVEPR